VCASEIKNIVKGSRSLVYIVAFLVGIMVALPLYNYKLQQNIEVLLAERKVLTTQLQLVVDWEQALDETINLADEHIGKVQEHCELRERDRSWTDSLSEDEKSRMYLLRKEIGGDLSVTAKDVMIYRAYYINQLRKYMNEILQPLKDTLKSWPRNMDKMIRQQNEMSADNAKVIIDNCFHKWQNELRAMQSTDKSSTTGLIVYNTYSVLSNFLHKAPAKLLPLAVKAATAYFS